jgi:hypothetical protein
MVLPTPTVVNVQFAEHHAHYYAPPAVVNARASAWDSDGATRRHLRAELLDTAC